MVRNRKLGWLVALLALPPAAMPLSAAADTGGAPVDVPCISALPSGLTSCPPQSQAQTQSQSQQQATPAQSSQPSSQTARSFSVSATPELARALLAEVNRVRVANGLRPLAYSARLTNAATAHARALATAGQFTHTWPTNGRVFSSWIRDFYPARGYRVWSVGENLLWASPGFTPASGIQQWLDSPAHRRVLLTPSWRELGIAVVSAVSAPGAFGGRDVQIAAAEFGKRRA